MLASTDNLSGRARRRFVVAAVALATVLVAPATAGAVTISINGFVMHSNAVTWYGAPANYHKQLLNSAINYTATNDNAHSYRVSSNGCTNFNPWYGFHDFAAHAAFTTGYIDQHNPGDAWLLPNTCFNLTARSYYGGQTNNATMTY